jgi:hypothetical protein
MVRCRHVAAKERELAFGLGWFADPIFGEAGDYPPVMRERVGARLPAFTAEESAMLKGSSDFFGFNWYSGRMTADSASLLQGLAALPSLVRMMAAEPSGLCGALRQWTRRPRPEAGAPRPQGNYFMDIGAVPSFRRAWRTTHMCWPVVPCAHRTRGTARVRVTARSGASECMVQVDAVALPRAHH